MKIAFVIGPYRSKQGAYGIKENIQRAEEVSLCLWKLGYAVICPHKNTALLDGVLPDEVWLKGDLEFLKVSDIAVTVAGWENSVGSKGEVEYCRKNKKPVLYHSKGVFNSIKELVLDDKQLL